MALPMDGALDGVGPPCTKTEKPLPFYQAAHHADEELGLLGVGADAGVTDHTDGHAGCQAGQTAGKAGGQVGVTVEEVVLQGLGRSSHLRHIEAGRGQAAPGRTFLALVWVMPVEMITAMMRP